MLYTAKNDNRLYMTRECLIQILSEVYGLLKNTGLFSNYGKKRRLMV